MEETYLVKMPRSFFSTHWGYMKAPKIRLPDGFVDFIYSIRKTDYNSYAITFMRTGQVLRDVKITNIGIPDETYLPLLCNDGRAEVKINMDLDGKVYPHFISDFTERDLLYSRLQSAETRLGEHEFDSRISPRSPKMQQEMLKIAEVGGDMRKAATYGSKYYQKRRRPSMPSMLPNSLFPRPSISPEYIASEYDEEDYNTEEYTE